MKKLERLTLKELGNSVEVLEREESIGLKGGDNNGASAYYLIYGTQLPEGTGYDVSTDTCYPLSSIPGPYNYQNPVFTYVYGCTMCDAAHNVSGSPAITGMYNALTHMAHDAGKHGSYTYVQYQY